MKVTISPGNPHDFSEGELEKLAQEIQQQTDDVTATVSIPLERGYGVTLHEVINLTVEVGKDIVALRVAYAVLQSIVLWARKRWQQDRQNRPDSKPRPRTITLWDGTGKAVKSVEINLPDGEPIEKDA